MSAGAPLPKAVNAVGDRIGLDYRIDRKLETTKYIENIEEDIRLNKTQLKNTFYSLNESKTKTKTNTNEKKPQNSHHIQNPLKLNSRLRKELYRLTNEEKQQMQYSTFDEINRSLWQQYASKVVNEGDLMSVFRMDLHGCKLKCTASKNPSLVGKEGIVVQETRNTFLVIKETNRLLTLPKCESIFEFKVGETHYKIHGCNLLFTTQTRSKVKYKQKKCLLDI